MDNASRPEAGPLSDAREFEILVELFDRDPQVRDMIRFWLQAQKHRGEWAGAPAVRDPMGCLATPDDLCGALDEFIAIVPKIPDAMGNFSAVLDLVRRAFRAGADYGSAAERRRDEGSREATQSKDRERIRAMLLAGRSRGQVARALGRKKDDGTIKRVRRKLVAEGLLPDE